MKIFEFVDFNKILKTQGKLSLLGIFGLKQDCKLEDKEQLKNNDNGIQKVIEEKEEYIL